jgi:hypothetical protein
MGISGEIGRYQRLVAEVGSSRLTEIHQAILQLLPCPTCGASICTPCVTVSGKNPGSPTQTHNARLKTSQVLYDLWYRMAVEEIARIDEGENPCLKTLGVGP